MSETAQLTEFNHMICDECGQSVRVRQDTQSGLQIECGCKARSIKVKRALPLEWSE